MPISRRASTSTQEAQTQESGVYHAAHGKRIDELDEAFEDDFPDVPSLMPSSNLPGPHDFSLPKTAAAVPELAFELAPPRKNPMARTSSSANIAAVRSGVVAPARGPALESEPPPAAPALALDRAPVRSAPMGDTRVIDSFDDDNVDIPLDIKARPTNQATLTTMSGAEVAPRSAGAPAPISSTKKDHDPRPGIVAFAGFGLPPETLGATPAYALRVITRKIQLRDDLRVARLRRIQDVSLYEAALECADESAVTKGLALIASTVIGGLTAIVAAAAFLL